MSGVLKIREFIVLKDGDYDLPPSHDYTLLNYASAPVTVNRFITISGMNGDTPGQLHIPPVPGQMSQFTEFKVAFDETATNRKLLILTRE